MNLCVSKRIRYNIIQRIKCNKIIWHLIKRKWTSIQMKLINICTFKVNSIFFLGNFFIYILIFLISFRLKTLLPLVHFSVACQTPKLFPRSVAVACRQHHFTLSANALSILLAIAFLIVMHYFHVCYLQLLSAHSTVYVLAALLLTWTNFSLFSHFRLKVLTSTHSTALSTQSVEWHLHTILQYADVDELQCLACAVLPDIAFATCQPAVGEYLLYYPLTQAFSLLSRSFFKIEVMLLWNCRSTHY